MEISVVKCTSSKEWDQFVDGCPQGSIFAYTWFLRAQGEPFECFIVTEKNFVIAGVIIFPSGSGMLRAPRPFSMYQGVLFNDLEHKPIGKRSIYKLNTLTQILEYFSENYKSLSWCQHYLFDDYRPFSWFNYEAELGRFLIDVRYTAVIDMSKYEDFFEYLHGIDKDKQKIFQNLKTFGVSVKIQYGDALDEFLTLYKLTFARQGIEVAENDIDRIKKLITSAIAENKAYLVVVRNKEMAAVTINVIFVDRNCAYYMFSASDPAARNQRNGLIAMLSSIDLAFQLRRNLFDMVGVNSPQRGFFKQGFNTELKMYGVVNMPKVK